MTFHAKAACISARPIPLATFRQHLLYSVCVTLLMAGPGFAQSVTPQPDNNPPLANQQNGNKTVGTGETLVINTGETVGNIILNGEKAWTTTESGIGGLANVFGQMSNGTVNKGGRLIVYAGGVAKDVAINDGGFAQTLDQGRISGTSTVNSGGILNVNAGGTAYDITVNDGGFAHILDQGRISGRSTVNMGGELYVNAGGTVKDVSVEGGNLWVEKDSKATGGITINGGKVDIIGEVTGKSTVNTGGKLHVNPHGTVKDVSVEGGYLWVQKDGKATGSITVNGGQADITVNGGQADITGEVTGKSTVNTGGKLAVDAGGAASDIIVSGNDSTQCTDDCSYLLVDGTSGDVTINNNGMLSGSGKIGNLTVHAGGAVSAGSGYDILGALTATGDATFDKGSIIQVNVANDGSRTNQFVVKGQANLSGGTVKLRSDDIFEIAADGTKILKYPSTEQIERLFQKTLVILTAEKGVTGRFDALTPQYDYNYITPSLTYTDKTVSLGVGLKNAAQIQDIVLVDAKTKNQKSVGSAIKSLGLGNPLLSTVLFSRKDEVLDYDALSGETHATLEGVLLHDAGLARDAVSDRVRAAFDGVAVKPVPTVALAYGPDAKKGSKAAGEAFVPLLPAVPTTAFWGEAYGSRSHADGTSNASAYSRNTGGFVTGFDGVIADTWRFGLLAGYGNTSVNTARGHASADSYQVGVYGGTRFDALTLSLGTSLAHHQIDTRRKVVFGAVNDSNTADYSANTVQLFGEAAYRIDTTYAALEPFAAAAYTHLKTDGFTETGGKTALSGQSDTTDLTTTTLGLRASHRFALSEASVLTAHGMAGWRHAFGDTTPEASLAFASGGQAFPVHGLPIASDTALVEAGLDFGIGKATTLGLSYTGQFSQQTRDNAVKANVTTRF